MKPLVTLSLITISAMLASLVITMVLSPFWNWFETYSGIESMGHSGPASWCFVLVFAIILVIGWGTWWLMGRRNG